MQLRLHQVQESRKCFSITFAINPSIIALSATQGFPLPARSVFLTLKIVSKITPGKRKFKTVMLPLNFSPNIPMIIKSENNQSTNEPKPITINETLKS